MEISSSNNTFKSAIAVIWLINRHFWKSKIGPIAAVTLPLIFMIFYRVIAQSSSISNFANGLSAYISLSILPITLIALPQVIVEFRNSIILRKISTSKINAFKFCTLLFIYYLFILIFSFFLIIVLYAIFLNKNAPYYFSIINWEELVYAMVLVFLLSLSFGLFLGVIIKKSLMAQIIGTCLIFLSMAFSGQIIPLSVLAKSKAMKYISLFSPLSYSLNLLNNILDTPDLVVLDQIPIPPNLAHQFNLSDIIKGLSIFKVNYAFKIVDIDFVEDKFVLEGIYTVFTKWQKILNITFPWILTFTFSFIAIKNFSWLSR